ncbi:hypothetical protein PGTUg99_001950 [Puccinia graminis f. sp. tritici]|uniref:Uncharacterized protein n=1 Tax=Puccinia graminis f. sp. tritici TaxID=56615 RepID=A0A5B0S4B1_PUCGR|nr:hypothetical protein PGTUg99_001950 [Puccinia graminis f. sp. tritici]
MSLCTSGQGYPLAGQSTLPLGFPFEVTVVSATAALPGFMLAPQGSFGGALWMVVTLGIHGQKRCRTTSNCTPGV